MVTTRRRRALLGGLSLLALGLALIIIATGQSAAQAETGQKALILDSSVSGGSGSLEATEAAANGFSVNVVSDAAWGAMTAAQFADYQLVVVGDPQCGSLPAVVSQNATALADAVMARAGGNTKAGNRMLIGTDPVYHASQGGAKLVEKGIDFVGVQDGATNLYLDFACGDPDYDGNGVRDGQDKLLPKLTIDAAHPWSQNASPPCGGSVSLISNAAQFDSLQTSDIQGWGCSVHETFPTFPTDWTALAIATDSATTPTCGSDVDTGAARCGEAYILIAGSGIVAEAPNLTLTPTTATNPVGTSHTVTAKVTNPNGTPRSGVVVSFVVTGANAGATGTCVPATCTTGAAGTVAFTYTGASAGNDTINAAITVDGSGQTATAAKTWVSDAGTYAITLTPASATNEIGTSHTVTAHLTQGGVDRAATKILFTVTGANTTSGNATTSAAGTAPFTYSAASTGTDTIKACGDINANGACDAGEPTATASKTWVATAKLAINDVTVTEGNTGLTNATFKVTLDKAVGTPVTVAFATVDGTAVAPSDYIAKSGSVTFAPGTTSKDVLVSIRGDTVNEPDETFSVKLSAASGAVIADATGVGTIIDDERDGAFTCRASVLRLTGLLEPVVANAADAPCRDATGSSALANLTAGALAVRATVLNAATNQTPDTLAPSAPAVGDRATAHSDSANAGVGLTIGVTATVADAAARCADRGAPVLSSSSKVVGLRVNGRSVDVVSQPVTISLLLATLRVNHTTTTAGRVTRRAIWLDNALLPDVVIGEASAGYTGNPCDA